MNPPEGQFKRGGEKKPKERRPWPLSVQFFHSFPFPKGEETEFSIGFPRSSPPFEKGRPGGVSGGAFSKR
jgi:hypothetical protein